jgi:hypothetical protein
VIFKVCTKRNLDATLGSAGGGLMSEIDDALIEAVALAIFKADQAFECIEGERLPDRHFKVAISLYRAMAHAAIDAANGFRANSPGPQNSKAAR